jgi:hypothetical protein
VRIPHKGRRFCIEPVLGPLQLHLAPAMVSYLFLRQ